MSYIQALAAQQTLELRQNLSKLADDAVETSHQLANVSQADAPDVLESEVEAQQAQLAVIMAEQNQQRVWKALGGVVGNPRLPLMQLEGKLEDTSSVKADELVEKIVNESPAVRIAELGVKRAEAAWARAKRETIPDLQLRGGLQQNGELLSQPNGRAVGLQDFADVGVRIPIFNRNQGNRRARVNCFAAAALSRYVKSSVRTKSFQQTPQHALLSAFCRIAQRKSRPGMYRSYTELVSLLFLSP